MKKLILVLAILSISLNIDAQNPEKIKFINNTSITFNGQWWHSKDILFFTINPGEQTINVPPGFYGFLIAGDYQHPELGKCYINGSSSFFNPNNNNPLVMTYTINLLDCVPVTNLADYPCACRISIR